MTLFSQEVADGVRAGHPDAIGAVYAELSDRLLAYLQARVRDRATAEDLLESTFVELIEKGHTIRGGPEVIKAWLFRAATFNALDHLRRRSRNREDMVDDPTRYDLADVRPGPESQAISSDVGRTVRAHMRLLSDEQQEVLLLRYVGGLTAPEVAEIVGKKVVAVRALQHRGERSLARHLEASGSAPASQDPARASQR